jgi:hypothetical protein
MNNPQEIRQKGITFGKAYHEFRVCFGADVPITNLLDLAQAFLCTDNTQLSSLGLRLHLQSKKPGPKPRLTEKAEAEQIRVKNRQEIKAGLRPPVKEAMLKVMGTKSMKGKEIYKALEAKGWLPNSRDPKSYIFNMLSECPELFERVSRGLYQVKGVPKPVTKPEKSPPTRLGYVEQIASVMGTEVLSLDVIRQRLLLGGTPMADARFFQKNVRQCITRHTERFERVSLGYYRCIQPAREEVKSPNQS